MADPNWVTYPTRHFIKLKKNIPIQFSQPRDWCSYNGEREWEWEQMMQLKGRQSTPPQQIKAMCKHDEDTCLFRVLMWGSLGLLVAPHGSHLPRLQRPQWLTFHVCRDSCDTWHQLFHLSYVHQKQVDGKSTLSFLARRAGCGSFLRALARRLKGILKWFSAVLAEIWGTYERQILRKGNL